PKLQFTKAPELLFTYYTKLLPSIPKAVPYNFFNTRVYALELNDIAAGRSHPSHAGNIVLDGMFHKLYIFARESNNVKNDEAPGKGICSTDTFLPISNVKIVMSAKTVFNGTNDQGLYQIS